MLVGLTVEGALRFYQPESTAEVNFSDFPLETNGWRGTREEIPQLVLNLLRPKAIFSGTYKRDEGQVVHLLFDFFVGEQSFGGPHSPRNCLPGGGWVINSERSHEISVGNRQIDGGRFALSYEGKKYTMDFWYITNYGETASDYKFRIYSLLSSLTLKPRETGFVRMIAEDSERGLEALEQFEQVFVPEVYDHLPFE